jgi:hypothetical protein
VNLPRALRGSASVSTTITAETIQKLISGGWQGRAYDYYDSLGEIHYAANFHARIGKLRFYVGRVSAQGEIEEADDSTILSQLGDVNALAETWGRQRFLGGESFAIEYKRHSATPTPEYEEAADEPTEWECLSPLELRRENDVIELLGRPKKEAAKYKRISTDAPIGPGECHLYRLWRQHPKNAYEVDAAMRSVQNDCERLRLIRAKDISETRSRIPAGVFFYPSRAFPLAPGQKPGETPRGLRNLQESLVKPIRDLSDPNAQVPVLIGVDSAAGEQDVFKHMTFERRGDAPGDSLKEERSVIAIARGLDLPVEYLTGVGAINHWGQWFIEDQLWKSHLQPLAQEFCKEWTEIFLAPLTGDDGLVLWYDETDIVAQPDKGQDAKDLFPLGAMTWDELREANGFQADAGPDDADRELIAGFLKGLHAPQAAPGDARGGTDQSAPDRSQNGASASADGLAAYRAREVAGNRLVNLIRRADPALLATLLDVPRYQVPNRVGRDEAVRLTGSQTPELVLLQGAAATYQAWLERQGYPADTVNLHVSQMLHDVASDMFDGAE